MPGERIWRHVHQILLLLADGRRLRLTERRQVPSLRVARSKNVRLHASSRLCHKPSGCSFASSFRRFAVLMVYFAVLTGNCVLLIDVFIILDAVLLSCDTRVHLRETNCCSFSSAESPGLQLRNLNVTRSNICVLRLLLLSVASLFSVRIVIIFWIA